MAETEHNPQRKRSPAYPAFKLKKAIGQARRLYAAEDRRFAPLESVAEHWSTKATNSGFLLTIATLKQYGLLEEEGANENRRVRITEFARELLEYPENSPEWDAAIQKAALLPTIHKELWDKYGGNLPSDSSLRVYLVRERQPKTYHPDHVHALIARFRDAISFAKLSNPDTVNAAADRDEEPAFQPGADLFHNKPATGPQVSAATPPSSNAVVRDFPIPLTSGGLAVLKVPVPMSETDFKQITGTLEVWKSALVRDESPDREVRNEPREPEKSPPTSAHGLSSFPAGRGRRNINRERSRTDNDKANQADKI